MLLWADGAEVYTTEAGALLAGWTGAGLTDLPATGGRNGGRGWHFNGGAYYLNYVDPTAHGTLICGFSQKLTNYPAAVGQIVAWGKAPDTFALVAVTPAGKLALYTRNATSGATTLRATSTQTFPLAVDHYVEAKIVGGAAGGLEVRVDEVVWATWSGNPGTDGALTATTFDRCYLRGNTVLDPTGFPDATLDDFYLEDTAYLGDIKVSALAPTGAGSSTGLTPSAGANWACVDEIPPNDDTDYVSATVGGALTDLYAHAALPSTASTVFAVLVTAYAKKTDAGAATLSGVVKSGATTSVATAQAVGTGYGYYRYLYATDPNGGIAWTRLALNAAEVGIRVV